MRRLRRRMPDPCGRPPDGRSRCSADAAARRGSRGLGSKPRVRFGRPLARPMGRPRLASGRSSRVWGVGAHWRWSGRGAASRRPGGTAECGPRDATRIAACRGASLQGGPLTDRRLAAKRVGTLRGLSSCIPSSHAAMGAAKRRLAPAIPSEPLTPRRGSCGGPRGEVVPWTSPAARRSELAAHAPATWNSCVPRRRLCRTSVCPADVRRGRECGAAGAADPDPRG